MTPKEEAITMQIDTSFMYTASRFLHLGGLNTNAGLAVLRVPFSC
jgi:hypothetical protein